MRYQVILTPGEDGWVVADCPSLPGCVSQGRSREEAINNIHDAMLAWLAVELEDKGGLAPPPQTCELINVDVEIEVPV